MFSFVPATHEAPNRREVRMDPDKGHWAADDFASGDTGYSYGAGDIARRPDVTRTDGAVPVRVRVMDPLGRNERARVSKAGDGEWEARAVR